VTESDAGSVRLAEVVAALSLGIDLGFGQPMEHVLRQCLIALRIAERLGLGDEERATVYYTALLVNVGCHTDAHEQAKWFGDDISMKKVKYSHEPRSVGEAATMLRSIGAGSPPLHRLRAGIAVALNRAELANMLVMHARLAGQLAGDLGLPDDVATSLACSYEQWDGKGSPGRLAGDASRTRRASLSSPTTWRSSTARLESTPRSAWPTAAPGRCSTRAWSRACAPTPATSSAASTDSRRGPPWSAPSRRSRCASTQASSSRL
jgi:hypothetical protein